MATVHTDESAVAVQACPEPDENTSSTLEWYKQHVDFEFARHRTDPIAICFAPNTPPEVMQLIQADSNGAPRFNTVSRWPGNVGDPVTISWSFVPDGLSIPDEFGGSSELFSRMDAQFSTQGGRAVWISRFQQCFDRWSSLTGITYVHVTATGVDWDDGSAWGTSGNDTTRGDVRISMKFIDGVNNILGYNSYPSNGDMVLDRSESWNSPNNSNVFLRDVVMHEHGHGLGLAHVCPINFGSAGRLMEPYLNTNLDGPRHDDLRGAQRLYGDPEENNNSSGTAANMGALTANVTLTVGAIPAPAIPDSGLVSIDADGETDWYRFSVAFPAKISSITLTPKGFTYDSSQQACSGTGSCCSGNMVNSLAAQNLNFQVIGSDGVTVLATVANNDVGLAESVTQIPLCNSPGDFYIKVYETGSGTDVQLYTLDVTAANADGGACCQSSGSCTVTSECSCQSLGGVWSAGLTCNPSPCPGVPSNPSPPSSSTNNPVLVTLEWNSVVNAAQYRVLFGTSPSALSTATTTSSTSYTRLVLPNTTYFWAIVAISGNGQTQGPTWSFSTGSTVDSDGDGVADSQESCPNDPNKTSPGVCGCGVADTDTDGDGTPDCHDGCPNDDAKVAPGQCGCGTLETDSDGDGTPDCADLCPTDPLKVAAGACGCGFAETDSDGDGTPDCVDGCPNDANKTTPGICSCGVSDTDTDGDGIMDCLDNCPTDANTDQADLDEDGIGDACDPDVDGDGVNHLVTNGPQLPGPTDCDDNDPLVGGENCGQCSTTAVSGTLLILAITLRTSPRRRRR